MDQSNTSGFVEDIIEIHNHANSSMNPEALKHKWAGNRGSKVFRVLSSRGSKVFRVLSSRTYPLRSSKSIFTVVHFISVVDKSLIDVVQTPTERAM